MKRKGIKPWWISFTDGSKNLGICIVDAVSEKAAHRKASLLGLNPGGAAAIFCMAGGGEDEVAEMGKDRLILPAELKAKGYLTTSEAEKKHPGFGEWMESKIVRICAKCNSRECKCG